MILVIDDEKTFPFSDDEFSDLVIYARTLNEGIINLKLIEDSVLELKELWLDHDLGGYDTIRPICLMLAERAFNGIPYPVGKIIVCSLNVVGAEWIQSTLEPYYTVVRCQNPEQLKLLLNTDRKAVWY